jgi:polyhydroxybutyrate depolymerase
MQKNKRLRYNIAFLFIGLLLPGPILNAQTIVNGSIIHDGISRTYRLYIPEIYNSSIPVPLLFNLHGYGSNNIEQEQYGDFRPIADTANFIIAHPNGTVDQGGNRFWNTFGGAGIDDVGFLSALIDTLSATYNIDLNRIYSTGMSNGGFMSYDLACFLSDRITAIASVTGTMVWPRFNTCQAMHPTPVMQIHGTADATVPYNGNILFAHIDSLVNHWVEFNNCWPVPEIIQIPDIDTLDGCTAEQHIFSNGDAGATVELFKVIGGGHSWPGAPININITNMDFSASVEIWRFFRKYSLDQLITGGRQMPQLKADFELYPNPASHTITLMHQNSLQPGHTRLMVYNTLGQQIYTRQVGNGDQNYELDISKWLPGLYIFVISDENGTKLNRKVLVR